MLGFGSIAEFAISEAAALEIGEIIFEYSGGAVFGGDNPLIRGRLQEFSGGVVLGGDNIFLRGGVQSFSGGAVVGGEYGFTRGQVQQFLGGLIVEGDNALIKAQIQEFSGGAVVGGDYEFYHIILSNALLTAGIILTPGVKITMLRGLLPSTLKIPTTLCIIRVPKISFELSTAAEGIKLL